MKRPRHSSASVRLNPDITDPALANVPDVEAQHANKLAHTDSIPATNKMSCALPPHDPLPFATYEEYETHYNTMHLNRCIECHRNLPTEHFLSLHIAENHDPITATRKDRGDKTYACFVDDCDKVCGTWQKRKLHLIDKHMFPRNYDFFIVNDGMDGRRSMLRPEHRVDHKTRRSHQPAKSDTDLVAGSDSDMTDDEGTVMTPESGETDGLAALTDAVASLKFVPSSVRFGRKKGLSGLSQT